MKTRKRAIARTGVFGSNENAQIVTQNDLQEIVESFTQMDSSPITLGHDFSAQNPRLGDVVTLELQDGILYGTMQEHDTLADAVEQGFFPDISIGAKRSAETGKLYLHHLAYLGEEPPAIKNLRSSIQQSLAALAASDIKDVRLFPSVHSHPIALSDTYQGGSFMNEEEMKKKIAELEAKNAELTKALETAQQTSGSTEECTQLKAENETLKTKLAQLAEKYPEEDLALSDTSPQTKALLAEMRKTKIAALQSLAQRKISPAACKPLLALADTLPATASITLSDGAKTSHFELLTGVLNELPDHNLMNDVIGLSDPVSGKEADAKTYRQCVTNLMAAL